MTVFLDFPSLRLPASPNTYLVAPEGLCRMADPHELAPRYAVAPDVLFRTVTAIIRQSPRIRVVDESGEHLAGEYAQISALMRFEDRISLKVVPTGGGAGASLALYSRSLAGYWDLGVNRSRCRRWLTDIARHHTPVASGL